MNLGVMAQRPGQLGGHQNTGSYGPEPRDNGEGGNAGGRGNFNGRGRGRGGNAVGRGAGRGARRGTREDKFDMVVYQPSEGNTLKKQAVLGNARQVNLQANYFKVNHRPDWIIYHYRVDTKPDEFDTRTKKILMRPHAQTLGAFIFDGASLYSSYRLSPDVRYIFYKNNAKRLSTID